LRSLKQRERDDDGCKCQDSPLGAQDKLIKLSTDAVREISTALRVLLADAFALYIKTKNFHWHMTGVHFRDHHLLLDERADQIFAMTDDIAERARKIGGKTIRSIGDIARHQRVRDNDGQDVSPRDMLVELCVDSRELTGWLTLLTSFVKNVVIWQRRACWKTGLTQLRGGPGFCLRPREASPGCRL
jgi:starvation-inducible DNA-binding protein